MNKNFTIKDISEVLDRLGEEWVMDLIYRPKTDSYKAAKVRDFDQKALLLTRQQKYGVHHHITVEVNDEKFIFETLGKKHDVSDIWQEVLGNVNQV